jgi:PleD family two-component response regulator
VANAVPEKSQSHESLVQHAHRRLLAAKQSGRNTVC